MLKYLSIKFLTRGPKKCNRVATAKNLSPRPNTEANINVPKFNDQIPADIVNTLYGIGDKAEANIAQNALSANNFPTVSNAPTGPSRDIIERPKGSKNTPMKYPNIPPKTEAIIETKAYQNDFFGLLTLNAICNGSGGTGKNEASANESPNKAHVPYLCSAQLRTQS